MPELNCSSRIECGGLAKVVDPPYPFRESHHTVTFRARGHFRGHFVLEVESCQLLLGLYLYFESGIRMSRKRNDRLRFFERASEFATAPHSQSARISLFLEHFRRRLRSTPLLAQALKSTNAENCTSDA
jgi:hypothetical protein